ncbi:MAG: hypothetical protein EA360_04170 [Balneolaceae bacterium]|nr:MAG: hypothetical protein EA360_04170 [Balneolaceae bacterium]
MLIFFIGSLFFTETGHSESSVFGGNKIAVSLSSDSVPPTSHQINLLQKSGISLIELSDPRQITFFSVDFKFIAGPFRNFILPEELLNSSSQLITTAVDHFQEFEVRAPGRIIAYNLFHYPYDARPSFFSVSGPIADSIRSETDLPIFYRSYMSSIPEEDHSFDFISLRYPSRLNSLSDPNIIYHFYPDSDHPRSLSSLELLLNEMVRLDDSLILLPDEWLFHILEILPDFHYILAAHTRGKDVEMIYPHLQQQIELNINFVLTFTVLLWAFLALLFKFRPFFVELFSRYFFNHSFLISDLVESRLRNRSESGIMLLLHCMISGIFFYTASSLYFSDISFDMLSYHAPFLFPDGYQQLVIFMTGILFATLFHALSITWLALFNKELRKLPFLLNIYAWPFLLNLFPFTLIVFLTQTDRSGMLSAAALILFFTLFIVAFIVAAYQGGKQLSKYRILNVMITAGLFCGTVIYLLYLLFTSDLIMEPLRLALWVS